MGLGKFELISESHKYNGCNESEVPLFHAYFCLRVINVWPHRLELVRFLLKEQIMLNSKRQQQTVMFQCLNV